MRIRPSLRRLAAEFRGPPGIRLTGRQVAGLFRTSKLNGAPAVRIRGTFSSTTGGWRGKGSALAMNTHGPWASYRRRISTRGSRTKLNPARNAARPVKYAGVGAAPVDCSRSRIRALFFPRASGDEAMAERHRRMLEQLPLISRRPHCRKLLSDEAGGGAHDRIMNADPIATDHPQ